MGKQGNASKYFCATVQILRNCSPPRQMSEFKVREGYKIAAILKYVQIYQIENSNFLTSNMKFTLLVRQDLNF